MKKKSKANKNSGLTFLFYVLLLAIAALGIFIRAKCYLANASLWHDECALAWNIKFKSYADLFEKLRFLQVAPPLFLISTKAPVDIFNVKNNVLMCDLTMLAIPFTAGVLSIFVFFLISKEVFTKKISQIAAMFLFAINYQLISYSFQLKQYSSDVLFVLLAILFFLKVNTENISKKALVILSLFAAASIWFSFVTIFFWAAGFLILLLKRKGLNNVGWLALPLFISCFAYAKLYILGTYSSNSAGMIGYWGSGFVQKSFANFIPLLIQNTQFFFSSQIYFAYAELLLVLVGIVTFFTQEKKDFAFISLLSFVFLITASVFEVYPFLDRVVLFLIPIFIVFLVKPLDFVDKNNKIVSILLLGLVVAITIPQGVLTTKYAMLKTYNKGEFPRETMQIIAKNIKKNDKIFITQTSNTEYFYYSSFYKFKNKLVYPQCKDDTARNIAALKALPRGTYWLYLPNDTSINKKTNRTLVLWSKNHAKLLKYNQKGPSVLAYVKK